MARRRRYITRDSEDDEIDELTLRAQLLLSQLSGVVGQMSELLTTIEEE